MSFGMSFGGPSGWHHLSRQHHAVRAHQQAHLQLLRSAAAYSARLTPPAAAPPDMDDKNGKGKEGKGGRGKREEREGREGEEHVAIDWGELGL